MESSSEPQYYTEATLQYFFYRNKPRNKNAINLLDWFLCQADEGVDGELFREKQTDEC